eukprot:UN01946
MVSYTVVINEKNKYKVEKSLYHSSKLYLMFL